MWKLLTVPFAAVLLVVGASHTLANPARNVGVQQVIAPGVILTGNKDHGSWSRRSGHHGHYRRYRHNHNRYYYYPNYRRYYRPYWGWDDCGWGYGYGPYGCFGSGFYFGGYMGGYYGDWYYDREYYPRRERLSNKKHVKWCKARYKTYNAKTDTFVGKGRKAYRCNSPYDGRR